MGSLISLIRLAIKAAPDVVLAIQDGLAAKDAVEKVIPDIKKFAEDVVTGLGETNVDFGEIFNAIFKPMTPEEEQAWFDRAQGKGDY